MRKELIREFIVPLLGTFLVITLSGSSAGAQSAPGAAQPIRIPQLTPGLLRPEAQQWHLKVSFQAFDEQGNIEDRGIFEEYWGGPNKSETVFASKTFNRTSYRTENGAFQTGDQGTIPLSFTRVQGAVLRSWSGTDQPVAQLGVLSVLFTYSHPILYLGKPLPSDFEGTIDGKTVLTAHVESIEPLTADDASRFVLHIVTEKSAPPSASEASPHVNVPAAAAANLLNIHAAPIYPPIARAARVQGTVVLRGLVGKDGHIEELQIINGPPMLQQAALDCVRSWTYRPYLVNGSPAEFQTTINVVFSLINPTQ